MNEDITNPDKPIKCKTCKGRKCIGNELKDHEIARLASMLQEKIGPILADKWNRECEEAGLPKTYDSGDCRIMIVEIIKKWRAEMGRD